jgi:hypothetical protein
MMQEYFRAMIVGALLFWRSTKGMFKDTATRSPIVMYRERTAVGGGTGDGSNE